MKRMPLSRLFALPLALTLLLSPAAQALTQIGRASCRERV